MPTYESVTLGTNVGNRKGKNGPPCIENRVWDSAMSQNYLKTQDLGGPESIVTGEGQGTAVRGIETVEKREGLFDYPGKGRRNRGACKESS